MRFNCEQIQIKLGDGGVIAMIIRDEHPPEEFTVVFADPVKLLPYIAVINSERTADYLASKKKAAQWGIKEALIDPLRTSADLAPEISYLPMARANCGKSNGAYFIDIPDGVARSAELICQKAECIPLQVRNKEANLLHDLVGRADRSPKPAQDFIVPFDVRVQRMTAYFAQRRANSIAVAS